MADSIASFAIDYVLQLMTDEAEMLYEVDDQVKTVLSSQFKFMSAFLRHSERARFQNELIKEVVNQLRDTAYDAEDTIDEYNVEAYLWSEGCCTWFIGIYFRLCTAHQVGKQIEDINKRLNVIKDYSTLYGFNPYQAIQSSIQGQPQSPRKPPIVEENEVVGFDDESNEIITRLLRGDNHLTVVSIFGMGGLGKTTLVKKVCNDLKVKQHFEQGCAWAFVSQEYSQKQLLQVILRAFKKSTEEIKMEEEEMGEQLLECLKGKKRYLIVLDDIWDCEVWEGLKRFFPDNNNGSRVPFTTRIEGVAREVDPSAHRLHPLNPDESWELLKKRAFQGERCNELWEETGKQIAKKCDGLPLAIVVLGGVLSYHRTTFEQWSNAVDRVSSTLSRSTKNWKEILMYSYNDLPDHQLRTCFLYFAVFPQGFEIPTKQLIRLWVAERLVQSEELAQHYLYELIDRNLVQVVKRRFNGSVKTCKIHDRLRDVCIDEAKKHKFILHFQQQEQDSVTSFRRLAGKSSLLRYIYSNCSSKPIRSILCFSNDESVPIDTYLTSFSKNLRLLRVLNLEGIAVNALPNEIGKLIHLRYLGLGRTTLTKLPDSICNLRNLQTLDVRSKSICSVPSGIWKLKQLRHVYLQGQIRLPKPTSSLKDLQTLSTICPSSCTQEMFAQMPNLIKLGIHGDLQSNLKDLANSRDRLQGLKSLKLKRDLTSAPVTILPRKFPENLTKITLHNTGLVADPLQQLGQLKQLQILKLMEQSYVGCTLSFNYEEFEHLQDLQLMNFYNHEFKVKMEEGALRSLERLVIHNCYSLQELPDELWKVTSLQSINLWEPSELVRTGVLEKENELKEHGCKIEVFPPTTS